MSLCGGISISQITKSRALRRLAAVCDRVGIKSQVSLARGPLIEGPLYRRPFGDRGLVRDFDAVCLGPVTQVQMPKGGLVAVVAEIPRYRASSTLTMDEHDFNVVAARQPKSRGEARPDSIATGRGQTFLLHRRMIWMI
jgi:hypothetical protein